MSANADYQRRYRAANKEKVRVQRRALYLKTKVKVAAQTSAWHAANPEKARNYTRRWRAENPEWALHLNRSAKQKRDEARAGRPKPAGCDACGRGGKICFDHSHNTGAFRGWLCSPCNTALGMAKDDPAVLRALALYLERAL